MVNVYITLLLVIFLLAFIVVSVTSLTVHKKKEVNAQNYDKHKEDKAWIAGMKAYCKGYYVRYNKRMKTQARIAYKIVWMCSASGPISNCKPPSFLK